MPDEPTPPAATTTPTGATDAPPVQPRAEAPPEPKGAEQIAEEARQKMAKMEGFWNRIAPEKKKEDPKPEGDQPKPEGDPAATPAPAPAPDKKPKGKEASATPPPEPKPRRKKEPEIDPTQIAETTGRAIGDQIAKSLSKTTPEPTPATEPELPEEFRRDTAVFEEMAKLDPKRYGNIKKDLAKYAKAEDDYIAKWETDHPGETFDGDSDEHNDFYKKVKPDFDQADFETAKESLIEQRAAARAEEKLRKDFEAREAEREQRRERTEQIRPDVEREIVSLMGDMLKEADPANAELAKDWASIQTIDQKNPLLADVMLHVHNETKPVVEASMRLFRSIDKFDPANASHAAVAGLVGEAEQAVLKLPMRERYDDDGRLFATQADYVKMAPAEKARHWFVGENELAALIRGRAILRTKALYERESKRISRYTGGAAATTTPNPPARKPDETPPPPKAETGSPSVSGRGSLPGDGQPAANKPSDGKGWFFSKYLAA